MTTVPGVDPGTDAADAAGADELDITKYPPTITKSRTTTMIAMSGPLFIFLVLVLVWFWNRTKYIK
jgi:uncharacterized protein involved in exopolysaccharide biosynthesis